jgi:hypothetical protein
MARGAMTGSSPCLDGACTVSGIVYPQTTLDMAADRPPHAEGTETFNVRLSNASNAAIADSTGVGMNVDND